MSTADYRQRVTVVGPFGQHQVDLPADVPVGSLLPDLLAMAGLHPSQATAAGTTWQLSDADGRPLADGDSLAGLGIAPGAILHLHGIADAARPARPGGPAAGARDTGLLSRHVPRPSSPSGPASDSQTPLQRVRSLLPQPVGRHRRLAATASAFLQPSDDPAGQQGGKGSRRLVWPPPGLTAESQQQAQAGQQGPAGPQAPAGPGQSRTGLGQTSLLPPPPGRPHPGQPDAQPGAQPGVQPGAQPRTRPGREPGAPAGGTAPAGGPAAAQPPAGEVARGGVLPADLTVMASLTRSERARGKWRELNHLNQLDRQITGPRLQHCATIAVVSPKGGVGKTTVTALLGTLFSLLRRDPTVAVDTNPDFGSLGRVLTPDQSWYVDDLARLVARDEELSLTALDSQLGRAIHGLLVVPAPTDPARMAALDEDAYRQVITRLKDFFSLILLDCGTGLQDPASAAAIASADQVVLITDAQPATASLVAQSADLLHQSGRPITVVVNRMPARGSRLDLERLSRYLPGARGLVVIPDHLVSATRLAGGGFDWRDAPPGWQVALRELAVVLVSDWQRLGLAR
jgi:MinD-like ATPase involved in chromosome partitioning or flagellar assembly